MCPQQRFVHPYSTNTQPTKTTQKRSTLQRDDVPALARCGVRRDSGLGAAKDRLVVSDPNATVDIEPLRPKIKTFTNNCPSSNRPPPLARSYVQRV